MTENQPDGANRPQGPNYDVIESLESEIERISTREEFMTFCDHVAAACDRGDLEDRYAASWFSGMALFLDRFRGPPKNPEKGLPADLNWRWIARITFMGMLIG